MNKLLIFALLLAGGGAGAWYFLSDGGASGPSFAEHLDAEHTVAFVAMEDLVATTQAMDRVSKWMPAEQRPADAEQIFDPAKRSALMGFDPGSAAGWASVGIDPAWGIAGVVDDRLRLPSGQPVPMILSKITDQGALIKALDGRGLKITLEAPEGGIAKGTVAGEPILVGQRGPLTAVVSLTGVPEDAQANVRPLFSGVLSGNGSALASTQRFKDASRGRKGRGFNLYVDTARAIAATPMGENGPQPIFDFYTSRFPAVSLWQGVTEGSSSGMRILVRGEGLTALKQIVQPKAASPKFSAYLPEGAWYTGRMSINLKELVTGLTALIPAELSEVRSAVAMAPAGLSMITGLTFDDLAAGFSGHFSFGGRMDLAISGSPVPEVLLGQAGLADVKKARSILEGLLTKAGIPSTPVELSGHSGVSVEAAGARFVALFTDNVLLLGSEAMVKAAAEKPNGISAPMAKFIDGDAFYGATVDIEQIARLMPEGNPQTDGLKMLPINEIFDGPFQVGMTLDDHGIYVDEATMVLGAAAAIAIPAFINYTKRAKVTEVQFTLMRIADRANTHYIDAQMGGGLDTLQFPTSTGPTPSRPLCSDGDRYVHRSEDWQHDTWKTLKFEPSSDHYFQYEFISQGSGREASFIVRARGDLDCDGETSLYEITGAFDGNLFKISDVREERPLE
ncbi:MAG: hypothetical protein ACE366_11785 [Bradymonadia bacterium]